MATLPPSHPQSTPPQPRPKDQADRARHRRDPFGLEPVRDHLRLARKANPLKGATGRERARFWWVVVAIVLMLAWLLGNTLHSGLVVRYGAGVFLLPIFLLLVPLVLTMAIRLVLARHAALDMLKRTGFKVCTRCKYDLSALPDDGQCPECGEAYRLADLRRIWRERYAREL